MNDIYPHWTAADAKASLSMVMDRAGESPQIIDRHGKPAGVVIGWDIYSRYREELEGTMKTWLKELAAINEHEAEMDPIIRSDRPLPEGLDV